VPSDITWEGGKEQSQEGAIVEGGSRKEGMQANGGLFATSLTW